MEKFISIQKDFDKLIGGGLISGNITHIYGPPASGKTNFAMIAMKNAAKEGKVIFIDSEGGFSIERLKQISGEEFENVLKNLLLIEPTDYDEQKVAIKKLDELVPKVSAKLVIVDSIAVLYRLEEEKDVKELGRQLAQLLKVARKNNIPVLITNQVYTDINTQKVVPIGGDILRYWAKIVISLEKFNDRRFAILEKHKFLPEGAKLEFKICEKGIEIIEEEVESSKTQQPSLI
ncbi:MAG: DNA repair and recombination protein RadB [Candidatus Altiarchaeota archaeon]